MRLLITLLLMAASAAVFAKDPPCAGSEHRQFDFWVGDWSVTNPAGQHAGDNTIVSTAGGCVIAEHWRGAKGSEGYSYNAYDSARKGWHQTWVDDSGLVLLLDGQFKDGSMVLQGPTGATLNRITWTPNKDGTVRQHWETSDDGGKAWKTAFDGLYRKKAP